MRSRVRNTLMELEGKAENKIERQKWIDLSAQMESARIGTIHSLCAEILRNHPADAGIDPRFEVLDEGISMALRYQAVDDTLKKLVEEDQFLPLLKNIPVRTLTRMLKEMLEKRLDTQEAFEKTIDNRSRLIADLRERMSSPFISDLITELRSMNQQKLIQDAGDKLAEMVQELLHFWTTAERALADDDPVNCAISLYKARRSYMKKALGGQVSLVKEIIAALQENYDKIINPLVGGKNAGDIEPSPEVELLFEELLPLLYEAFICVHQAYLDLMSKRQALDFDDLEHHAQKLLVKDEIRQRWQQEIDALLVDEYQDTNQRQRDIVNALVGNQGGLFIVGDMRQSIYRFRRADVTVFREEQRRIKREGGMLIDLDMTYRAHEQLLIATGDLLSAIIGTEEDPARPYYVPYTPLIANKKESPENIKPPHIEFICGAADDTETARPLAARALAERLWQLKREKQIVNWDEVALLFRAATGFPFYEEAFEDAGIPFVTVAGRGFYDRPEIRDLVNILRALADPMDDLSFAGLLRSPAFRLSDVALFQIRQSGLPYWEALHGDLSILGEEDRLSAERALNILNSLIPLVDRIPVAGLLKQAVDATDYRALLASEDVHSEEKKASIAGGRLWRNLDKLLEDAMVNQQVNVRDFLNLLTTLNDAGAREGEAPAEAEGAVRLMTIHKAKGLEFPVVVLADAGRQVLSPSELVYISSDLGVTFKLDPAPMSYNLAKVLDKDQDECETLRLLYVVLTRAKVKLLISSHATFSAKGGITLAKWAKDLDNAASNPSHEFLHQNGEPFDAMTCSGYPLKIWCLLDALQFPGMVHLPEMQDILVKSDLRPLYPPLEGFGEMKPDEKDEMIIDLQSWRINQSEVPGHILGTMVHKAIQLWLFPGDPKLESLLEMEAFNAGIANETLRREAINRATELMKRLRQHPLWEEINTATERYYELPYTYMIKNKIENRVIDLLYKSTNNWKIVDFKTDPIPTVPQRDGLVQEYASQVQRYTDVITSKLGQSVQAWICFLDSLGSVELVEV
jgi:ATP-dependent helicase/nuclease subunit A